MAKNNRKVNNLSLIIIGAIFAFWNLIVFTCYKFKEAHAPFWISYAFITIAFIVTACVAIFIYKKKGHTLNTLMPFYSVTFAYLAITFVINNILMWFPKLEANLVPILINALICVAFIILFVMVYMGASHIKEHSNYLSNKVSNIKSLAYSVNALTYKTTDPAIKQKLVALREKISISDPLSGEQAMAIEEDIKAQIDLIGSLLAEGSESATVIAAIDEAYNQVRMRNGIARK